jgi:hypothetical protein
VLELRILRSAQPAVSQPQLSIDGTQTVASKADRLTALPRRPGGGAALEAAPGAAVPGGGGVQRGVAQPDGGQVGRRACRARPAPAA